MKAYVFPWSRGTILREWVKTYTMGLTDRKNYLNKRMTSLGFRITDTMFEGEAEELKQTKVTQPAIFLHSVILCRFTWKWLSTRYGLLVISLGEFSALVANKALSFEDGLKLVSARAMAMQEACEAEPSTMAAVLMLEDATVESICEQTPGVVVAANYNCPGQLVISGCHRSCNGCLRTDERSWRKTSTTSTGWRCVPQPIDGTSSCKTGGSDQ